MFKRFIGKRKKYPLVKNHQIYEAVSNQDHEQLKILLKHANIREINSEDLSESALDLAASQGDQISVELLLAYGAIPDYNRPKHVWSKSTLSRAILNGNHRVIQLLVDHGYNIETILEITSWQEILVNTYYYNYWFKIVELNNLPIFQLLLECKGLEISNNDEWSQKMLITACGLGSDAIVEYLLDQGVSTESRDRRNWTCVFFAVAYTHITTLQLLVARGANINHADLRGRRLLHIAVIHYKVSRDLRDLIAICRLLLNNGADINATDNNGFPPFSTLLTQEPLLDNIVTMFLYHKKTDFLKPDNDGITVLHRAAARMGSDDLVDLLYKINVDFNNVKDNMGRTPLHFVNTHNYCNLDVLLEFGGDTEILHSFEKDTLVYFYFLHLLGKYRLKRSIANLSNDSNIDILLAHVDPNHLPSDKWEKLVVTWSNEIERMKNTILCDNLTYYDFLHAKKRTCIKVAKTPGMYDVLIKFRYKKGFKNYVNMLAKNFACGMRPLTPIESHAINFVENNLDVIFNNNLPSLIVYKIKRYIDIEDMVTLDNMKLFD